MQKTFTYNVSITIQNNITGYSTKLTQTHTAIVELDETTYFAEFEVKDNDPILYVQDVLDQYCIDNNCTLDDLDLVKFEVSSNDNDVVVYFQSISETAIIVNKPIIAYISQDVEYLSTPILSGEVLSPYSIKWTWNESYDCAYEILDAEGKVIHEIGIGILEYTEQNLKPNTNYTRAIRTYNATQYSQISDYITLTTEETGLELLVPFENKKDKIVRLNEISDIPRSIYYKDGIGHGDDLQLSILESNSNFDEEYKVLVSICGYEEEKRIYEYKTFQYRQKIIGKVDKTAEYGKFIGQIYKHINENFEYKIKANVNELSLDPKEITAWLNTKAIAPIYYHEYYKYNLEAKVYNYLVNVKREYSFKLTGIYNKIYNFDYNVSGKAYVTDNNEKINELSLLSNVTYYKTRIPVNKNYTIDINVIVQCNINNSEKCFTYHTTRDFFIPIPSKPGEVINVDIDNNFWESEYQNIIDDIYNTTGEVVENLKIRSYSPCNAVLQQPLWWPSGINLPEINIFFGTPEDIYSGSPPSLVRLIVNQYSETEIIEDTITINNSNIGSNNAIEYIPNITKNDIFTYKYRTKYVLTYNNESINTIIYSNDSIQKTKSKKWYQNNSIIEDITIKQDNNVISFFRNIILFTLIDDIIDINETFSYNNLKSYKKPIKLNNDLIKDILQNKASTMPELSGKNYSIDDFNLNTLNEDITLVNKDGYIYGYNNKPNQYIFEEIINDNIESIVNSNGKIIKTIDDIKTFIPIGDGIPYVGNDYENFIYKISDITNNRYVLVQWENENCATTINGLDNIKVITSPAYTTFNKIIEFNGTIPTPIIDDFYSIEQNHNLLDIELQCPINILGGVVTNNIYEGDPSNIEFKFNLIQGNIKLNWKNSDINISNYQDKLIITVYKKFVTFKQKYEIPLTIIPSNEKNIVINKNEIKNFKPYYDGIEYTGDINNIEYTIDAPVNLTFNNGENKIIGPSDLYSLLQGEFIEYSTIKEINGIICDINNPSFDLTTLILKDNNDNIYTGLNSNINYEIVDISDNINVVKNNNITTAILKNPEPKELIDIINIWVKNNPTIIEFKDGYTYSITKTGGNNNTIAQWYNNIEKAKDNNDNIFALETKLLIYSVNEIITIDETEYLPWEYGELNLDNEFQELYIDIKKSNNLNIYNEEVELEIDDPNIIYEKINDKFKLYYNQYKIKPYTKNNNIVTSTSSIKRLSINEVNEFNITIENPKIIMPGMIYKLFLECDNDNIYIESNIDLNNLPDDNFINIPIKSNILIPSQVPWKVGLKPGFLYFDTKEYYLFGNKYIKNNKDINGEILILKDKVDIVFLIDNTGSMKPIQDIVADNISNFIDKLSTNINDLRIGITTYDGPIVNTEAILFTTGLWTIDINEIKNKINNLVNNNIQELVMASIDYVIATYDFRSDSSNHIILVTDEDADDAYKLNQTLDNLINNNIHFHAIFDFNDNVIEYENIVNKTNGESVNISKKDWYIDISKYIAEKIIKLTSGILESNDKIPITGSPIIVKDDIGNIYKHISSIDVEEEVKVINKKYLYLKYNNIDISTLKINNILVSGIDIINNIVILPTNNVSDTLNVKYNVNFSFSSKIIDNKLDIKIHGGDNHNIIFDTSNIYIEDNINLNPLRNKDNFGFLYLKE